MNAHQLDSEQLKDSYYLAALRLLRFIEHRAPTTRRFGEQADAAWKQFAGALKTTDRIQLMIADAHAQWPGSVGPSVVCNMPGVAEDDAFGPDWQPLGGAEAERVWSGLGKGVQPKDVHAALSAIADAWGISLAACVPPDIKPGQVVVVAGPSALAGLVEYFASHADLAWPRQVTAIATPPGHRQLAAAAGALLNFTEATVVHAAGADLGKLKPAHVIVSGDAQEADAAAARALGG